MVSLMIPQLCHVTNLRILDLAQNQLSGTIPLDCFANFNGMKLGGTVEDPDGLNGYDDKLEQVIKRRKMEYTKTLRFLVNIDLSSNNMAGQIPMELASLSGLNAVNLSKNQLTGCIPEKIGNLKSLEALDFSENQLSGTIPQSISDLSFMSNINLSYNNLSGQIPSGNQLQTLDSSSFIGNPELRGILLEKKCAQDSPSEVIDDDQKEEEEEEFENAGFYISMGVGIASGFWSFCSILLFLKAWRCTYIRFAENLHGLLVATIVAHTVAMVHIFLQQHNENPVFGS
ncbi:hypothetical protein IFM89_007745 [Coptis chinensis]|uniref:Uncharacterized protein n=1 Tax=Coptis chinensis TaxID=261450 RepID=A0A835IXI1_9MAGN|nr:hypothetical protein IFM89_007745 [Coptis chinensis]